MVSLYTTCQKINIKMCCKLYNRYLKTDTRKYKQLIRKNNPEVTFSLSNCPIVRSDRLFFCWFLVSSRHTVLHWQWLSCLSGHRRGHMAVSWVAVMILTPMLPGISSAICRPLFLSWSLCGSVESFTNPDSTTWPMNSSFTALLFHTWGWPVSFHYGSERYRYNICLVVIMLIIVVGKHDVPVLSNTAN